MTAQLSLFGVETEAQVKARKLAELAVRDAEDLERRRKAARYLVYSNNGMAVHRVPNSVCMDDVMEYLELRRVPRNQARFKKGHCINGQVFRGGEWVKIGRVKSRREGRRNNEIALWTLKGYEQVGKGGANGL